VADIFVSYTSKDREWAFWIGQELEKLGHVARIDAWEIAGGGNIMAWMLQRLDTANHTLCVISPDYYKGPFASAEFQAALWAAQESRSNFLLPVRISDCELRRLLAPLKRCDLFGINEGEARDRFIEFLKPAGKPSKLTPFPGERKLAPELKPKGPVAFPGTRAGRGRPTISNIPINVPRHFLGRDSDLAAIDAALKRGDGRAAVTALHGLRGVGKTVLAAAYAERHSPNYRATWWVRAETESTMRADLVGLGVRLDWLPSDAPEEPALKVVMERLRDEGDNILLIYDNATNAREFEKCAPRGGAAHVIVTSNAPDWRGVAEPVEIEIWPLEIGADFLIERTGLSDDREAALALSEKLGGLPLAHEQAAAYCGWLGVGLASYASKFAAAPAEILADERTAPEQYHNGLTVSKTYVLAIEEAAKLHPAAEPLIVYAALLAPEPIPLFLFRETPRELRLVAKEGRLRKIVNSIFALINRGTLVRDNADAIDEAVAALRAFALVDCESIVDERDPTLTTECIRLHRLVRQIAAARHDADASASLRCELIVAIARVYPRGVGNRPETWPRARRLDAIAIDLIAENQIPEGAEAAASYLMDCLASYRQDTLAAYADARSLLEQALNLDIRLHGAEHPETAASLNNLGSLLLAQGDLVGARPYWERALAVIEKVPEEHQRTATSLSNLGSLLQAQGDLAGAQSYHQRALVIREKALGADHPDTAGSLNNLGGLLHDQGDFAGAQSYFERALAVRERTLGTEHPQTATSINNLGGVLQARGDLAKARSCYERGLTIREKVLGTEHPDTANSLNNLGFVLQRQGDLVGARLYWERALAIREKVLGAEHPDTANSLNNFGSLLAAQGDISGAHPLIERALVIREQILGADHPDTAKSLNSLGSLMHAKGDMVGARSNFERALKIVEAKLGTDHQFTLAVASNIVVALDQLKLPREAAALRQKYGLADNDDK
jgi:tetratricopeptide (TPR) repeat protein